MENEGTKTENNSPIEGKIRTIRFILLSAIIYFITDAMGRWSQKKHLLTMVSVMKSN